MTRTRPPPYTPWGLIGQGTSPYTSPMHTLRYLVLMLWVLLPFQTAVAGMAAPALPAAVAVDQAAMPAAHCAAPQHARRMQHPGGSDSSPSCAQHCAAQNTLAAADVAPAMPPFVAVCNAAPAPAVTRHTTAPPLRPPLSA